MTERKPAGTSWETFSGLFATARFRRTAARDMIRSGTPETVVMAVTGHTTRAMLDRYNITSERDTREAMEALSARRAGKGGEA
jgi:hypothetical protein